MLVLLNQVIGGSDLLSGGEKIVVELLRRWRSEMEIEVMIPSHGLNLLKDKENLEVRYLTLPETFLDKDSLYWKHLFLIPLVWLIHTLRGSSRILKTEIKDKKLYSAGDFYCNTIPAFLKKMQDKEISWIVSVFHIIDSPVRKRKGQSFLANLASYLFQNFSFLLIKAKVNIILVLNSHVKSQLASRGFDERKIQVTGAGIDFQFIDAVSSGEEPKYDAGFMARLSPSKGAFELPKIWSEVAKEKQGARLLVIGGGMESEENRMRALIQQFNLERQIEMAGFKTGTEKYRLMKSCKVFIFPSYEEGFAISILEAMACGLPVVAWDLPAYKTIYNDNLITVAKGDIASFVSAVTSLLTDEKMRQAFIQKGYDFARQHDWDIVAQKAHKMIEAVF